MKKENYDTPWKTILRHFLQAFLEFCLPDAAEAIDWSKEYIALDKELEAMSRQQEIGNRIADLLFKVWLKNGEEVCLLLHVELQAGKEERFSERMFTYHYRILDRYKKSVMSVAVLTDDDPKWCPTIYQRSGWHNTLSFKFATIKLLNYTHQLDSLRQQSNPFAIVIWAHLASLQTRKEDKKRLDAKITLTRALYEHGYSKAYILDLFAFIDWVLALPEPLEVEYVQAIETIEQEKKMQYITSVERIGIQKGLQQGRQEGRQEGEAAILIKQMQRRFGDVPAAYAQRIKQADANTLLGLAEKILDAKNLSELFEETERDV